MTVYKAVKTEADAAAALAIALAQGRADRRRSQRQRRTTARATSRPSLLTPVSVTKDNIKETVIADGFRTWDEICTGKFAQSAPPAER